MYPWENISPENDSTLRLVHEAVIREHTVAIATTGQLTIRDSVSSAFCDVVVRSKNIPTTATSLYKNIKFRRVQLPLAGFDAIILRDNPPLDTLALNFLDSVKNDVFIMNDINGLRIANNKLYTTGFQNLTGDFVPTTHVSKNRDYLERVFNESENDKMILKPLAGYGGQGVIVVEKSAKDSFRSLLDFYIDPTGRNKGNYVILQDYVTGAEEGDVRILLLNGQPIGAMRRLPAKGEVRSNVHVGGTAVKHVLTKHEKRLCEHIGSKLVQDGIYFAGIDVIGGKLIEVNVQSPGGIARINKLNRVKLQKQVLDFVENVVDTKEGLVSRRNLFRQAIEDVDVV